MKRALFLILFSLLVCGGANALTVTTQIAGLGIDAPGEDQIPDPPPTNIKKILPLGDSITRGSLDSPIIFGYRDHLQDLLGIAVYDFVGPFKDPSSNSTYDVDHDGVGGNDTNDILLRISSNLATYLPTPNDTASKVLLMIGTNDIKDGFSESTTVDNVETIIGIIDAFDTTLNVYVALIIPSKNATWDADFSSYNTALNTRLVTLQATKTNLHIVDMNTAFKTCNSGIWTACIVDTLHPTDAGYSVIANTWYSCIQNPNNAYCDGH